MAAGPKACPPAWPVALLAALLFLPSKVSADMLDVLDALSEFRKPNMRIGLMELHPYYTYSETYDSNIYLVPADHVAGFTVGGGVQSSWIHENDAGLRAQMPFSQTGKLDLGYDGDYRAYSAAPSANNAFRQKADGAYTYRDTYLRAGIADTYLNTVDPAFSELIERQHRWENTVAANAEYGPEGGFLFAGVDAFHRIDKYLDPELAFDLNNYEEQFGFKAGYWLAPKTRVYAAYHRDIIHYTAGRDASSMGHLADFGIEGVIAPKISGQIQTGLEYREYDFDPLNPEITRVTRNWRVGISLTYRPQERTTVTLDLRRGLEESTFLPNRFYIATLAAIALEHKLPWKFTIGTSLSYGINKYPEAAPLDGSVRSRRDDLYSEEIHFRYDLQDWLYTTLSYQHRDRFSSFASTFNYDDDITTVSLGIRF